MYKESHGKCKSDSWSRKSNKFPDKAKRWTYLFKDTYICSLHFPNGSNLDHKRNPELEPYNATMHGERRNNLKRLRSAWHGIHDGPFLPRIRTMAALPMIRVKAALPRIGAQMRTPLILWMIQIWRFPSTNKTRNPQNF